jgi:hypothetical protein
MTGSTPDLAPASGRIDPAFEAILSRAFQVSSLDRQLETVVALWPDFRIAYVNPAWDTFAERNGGLPAVRERWDIGANYLDAIAPPLRPFFQRLLETAPDSLSALHSSSHDYECSSATTYRLLNVQVFTLHGRTGYVLVHSSRIERPHSDPVVSTSLDAYVDANGLSRQCSHCRRVERVDEPGRWDWVPLWVASPPAHISHSICPACFDYYYGVPADSEDFGV